jgi:predicted DNA-binding ribbon-helix-helix protein
MPKYSVTIAGHRTSISLEEEFWLSVKKIAREKDIPISALISRIDKKKTKNLSSALRIYVLKNLKTD